MEAYSLNQPILPGKPLTRDEHRRAITWLIIALVVLVVGGIFFWFYKAPQSETRAVDEQAVMRAKVTELLKQAPGQASQAEVDKIATLLSQSDSASAQADNQAVKNALSNKQ